MFKVLALLFFINSFLFAQSGGITGTITADGKPLPAVNVFIEGTFIGSSSNENGFYIIRNIPPGNYTVRYSAIGFKTERVEASISSNKILEINIDLKEDAIELEQIEVTGNDMQGVDDTRSSLIDLKPRDAKIMPGAAEDVFRTLQSLPGVLAPNDFSSQLIIRGSTPDQNLIIMDDVEVFNPYRLYGVISMFNPEAVSDVELLTGGFPAKYGDRLSAVLDVTNKEGNSKKAFGGNVNVSIVDANVLFEGKNPFNIEGSWMINSRRTYYDLIVEPFVKNAGLVEDNVNFPNFYDFQGKLVFGPFNGHKILINGIYSRDGVNVVSGDNRRTADSIGVYNLSKNDVVSAAWHYAPNKNLLNKFITSWYRNSGDTDFDSEILDPSLNRDLFEDSVPDTLSPYLLNFKFKSIFNFEKFSFDNKLTYLWGNGNNFEAGIGMDFMETLFEFDFELDEELKAFFGSNPQFRAVLDDVKDIKHYERYRAYAQNKFKLSDKFFVNPGVRIDYYDLLEKIYFAPRVSISYALDNLTTIRSAWGIYYQSPGYEKMRDRSVLFTLDKEFTRPLESEKSIHYILGIDRWITNEWNLKLEAYYKDFEDIIVSKRVRGTRFQTEQVPGQNPRYRGGWTNPSTFFTDSLTQIPVNEAYGEAYGLEFYLAKKNISRSNKLSGWVSYALAFADQIDNNVKSPFRFDQRHTVNIVLNYQINSWLDVGVRWQYGSGFPFSEPKGVKPRILMVDSNLDGKPDSPQIAVRRDSNPDTPDEVIFDVNFDERYNSRKPDYHRLDLRITALADYWGLDWSFYLDVINVYNHKNVIGYDYYVTEDLTLGKEASTMFPILPTLGFAVRF